MLIQALPNRWRTRIYSNEPLRNRCLPESRVAFAIADNNLPYLHAPFRHPNVQSPCPIGQWRRFARCRKIKGLTKNHAARWILVISGRMKSRRSKPNSQTNAGLSTKCLAVAGICCKTPSFSTLPGRTPDFSQPNSTTAPIQPR
jgi:hypothetical protein